MKEKNGGNGGKTRANEAAERSERVPEREGWKERDGKRGMERGGKREEGGGSAGGAEIFVFDQSGVGRLPPPNTTGNRRLAPPEEEK